MTTVVRSVGGPTRWALRLICGLLLTAVCGVARADQQDLASLLKSLDVVRYPAGTAPPAFEGQTLDGRQVSLAELRGNVVLLNFWATWCVDCRPEMPALERLHRDMARKGLSVMGINARESTDAISRYAKEFGLTFPLVLDNSGKIGALYGVIGVPTTFVVGRDGRAVALAIGPRDWGGPVGRMLLQALLAEPSAHAEVR